MQGQFFLWIPRSHTFSCRILCDCMLDQHFGWVQTFHFHFFFSSFFFSSSASEFDDYEEIKGGSDCEAYIDLIGGILALTSSFAILTAFRLSRI